MGFFAEFDAWLTGHSCRATSRTTRRRIARHLEPAIVTLGVFYVIVWGYLQLLGKIEEPFVEGAKRLLTLALILGLSLQLWLYNDAIVDTFFSAPTALAAAHPRRARSERPCRSSRSPSSMRSSSTVTTRRRCCSQKGEIFGRDIIFYFAAFVDLRRRSVSPRSTRCSCSPSAGSRSPSCSPWDRSSWRCSFSSPRRRFFEAWLAQLSNYAFLTVLTVLVAALMLQVVSTAAAAAVAAGGGIDIASAIKVCVATTLTFLIMRQVPAMAQGLASGIALSGFGAWAARFEWRSAWAATSARRAGEFSRGAFRRPRHEPLGQPFAQGRSATDRRADAAGTTAAPKRTALQPVKCNADA